MSCGIKRETSFSFIITIIPFAVLKAQKYMKMYTSPKVSQ
jgi:hypothetical protein